MAARGNGAGHTGARHGHGVAASGRKGAASMAGPQWVRTFAMDLVLHPHAARSRDTNDQLHSALPCNELVPCRLMRAALATRSR
jgi:hypothetical protein